MFNLNLSQNRLYLSRIYVFGRFFRTVSSSIEEETVTKRKKKKKVFPTNGKPIFLWKEICFQSLSFINFFHRKTSRLHECSKTFLPLRHSKKPWFISRQQNTHFTTTVSKTFSAPFTKSSSSVFSPNLAFFFFFLRRTKFSPQTSRKRIRSCLIISRKLQCNL